MGAGTLLAKVDLEHAYRNIPIHRDDRLLLAMRWRGKLYLDTVLPFGLRSAPKILPSYCHIVTLSYCHILSNCLTILLSYCHTVLLSYCHTVTLSYCHTVLLSHCLTVILSHTSLYHYIIQLSLMYYVIITSTYNYT